ncbi:hypothetical protein KSP39_PZI010825 [Platanthera zijinensis]|uniref:Uncharacterized protein n=1 Tax=Platanthera zijinensis TaxID=2320716 RepID=A0AAP0BH85_9ASPA
MPTFTAIALDRLLEPASLNSTIAKPPPVKVSPSPADSRPPLALPALYATPSATPLPDIPGSFPPSPYIVDHKRRGPRLQKPPSPVEAEQVVLDFNNDTEIVDGDENLGTQAHVASFEENISGNGIAIAGDVLKLNSDEAERDGEADDFLEFLDSMSSASNLEGDDSCGIELPQTPGTPVEEYYSAYDEISSDGASSSPFRKVEIEIREMRLNLLMEIERRKDAEEAVEIFQKKWQNLRQHLSTVGLVLPNLPRPLEEEASVDPIEDLRQQIVVARTVTASVARGCARAEAEMEIEPRIRAKNFEIARLLDRLHYYEAATREMSQRNQEAIEKARQQRHRRNKRQKWFWGSIGFAVTLGSAAIAWSYLPSSKTLPRNAKNDH